MCAPHLVSVLVDTQNPGRIADEKIVDMVRAHFQLTPRGIIESLDLRRPIYRKTAAFGHFGRCEPEFTWERTDKAAVLRSEAGLVLARLPPRAVAPGGG